LATAGFQAVEAPNTKSENPRFAKYFRFIYELYQNSRSLYKKLFYLLPKSYPILFPL
jgi:hypothetical protein